MGGVTLISIQITKTIEDDDGDLYDPGYVTYVIEDLSGDEVDSGSATRVTTGVYRVNVDLEHEGVYTVRFDVDGEISEERFIASDEVSPDDPGDTLTNEFTLEFTSGVEPLLIDPEYVSSYAPDVAMIDVMQAIHKFSIEVVDRYPNGTYPSIALDYIHAASLCYLSRRFDGIGSSSSDTGFTLGDLSVSNSPNADQRKGRGNAGDWCEMAEILREEMVRYSGHIKSTVKAIRWGRPHPNRRIRPDGSRFLSGG